MCHLQAHETSTKTRQSTSTEARAKRYKTSTINFLYTCIGMHILYYEKLKSMRQVIKYLKDYATPYNTFYLKDVGFVIQSVR